MVAIKIVTTEKIPPEYIERITAEGEGIELVLCQSEAELNEQAVDCDVIYGRCSPATLQAAKKLQWIQFDIAGVEKILCDELIRSRVILTNMAYVFGGVLSEHAFALILSLTRGIPRFVRQQMDREWNRLTDLVEIKGMTMGVVGFGGIGSEIARRAYYGFDMTVLAVDARPLHKPHFVQKLGPLSWLMEMVPRVDFLVNAAPYSRPAEKMFNESVFSAMRPSAYFINISRGKLVDESALIRALKEGKIAGAGLDVTAEEPLPKESELWALPNVIITSHSGSQSPYRYEYPLDFFVENLRRFVKGEPLLNVVDKEKGY